MLTLTRVQLDDGTRVRSLTGQLPNGDWVHTHVENGLFGKVDLWKQKMTPTDPGVEDIFICPGFIDLQVNGFAGININADDFAASDLPKLVESLWARGVTSFLPTIITGSKERMQHAIEQIRIAREQFPTVRQAVLGLHVEGPYLSSEDGPRGAHDRKFIRDPDWSEFEQLNLLSGHLIKMVTVAPERRGSIQFIARAAESGLIVALGHTAATPEQIAAAVKAGASISTHLGNGSHPLLKRHDNYIWEQLAEDGLWASLIADGHHLPGPVLKSFIRAKQQKVVLVSDAVHLAGMAPGLYSTNIGGMVELLENGRLQMASDPRILAGSAAGLNKGLETVLRETGVEFSNAICFVTENPSLVLGNRQIGQITRGRKADCVLVGYSRVEARIRIIATIVEGRLVYSDASSPLSWLEVNLKS